MEVQVCVGSACHLKGSYEVAEKLKKLCGENSVRVSGSFCCGACENPGVSVKIDGKLYHVAPDGVEEFYSREIQSRIHSEN